MRSFIFGSRLGKFGGSVVTSLFGLSLLLGLGAAASFAPGHGSDLPAIETSVPRFSHVILILIENKEFDDVIGNANASRFNRWARQYSLLTRYHSVSHPSLPNYLALISGDTFGFRNDCTECFVKAKCLPDLLEAKGLS